MKNMIRRGTILLALIFAAAAMPCGADAAPVVGRLIAKSGHPVPGRQLHFQNRIASDIYLADTTHDGEFRADLPPGVYTLRNANGAVLRDQIAVADKPVNLHNVTVLAKYSWRHYLQRQEIGEAILKSPAPSTANLYTEDVNFYGTATAPAPLRPSRLYRAREPLPGLVNPNLPNLRKPRAITPGATMRQMPEVTPPTTMPAGSGQREQRP